MTYTETITEEKTISYEQAAELIADLEEKKLIDKKGKIKDTMKKQIEAGTLDLGERYSAAAQRAILQSIRKANVKLPIGDGSKKVSAKYNKEVMISPEFMEIWGRIKQKTTYRVKIDTERLMKDSIKELKGMPDIHKPRLVSQTADIDIKTSGVTHMERGIRTEKLESDYTVLPDIIRVIAAETLLKRSTVGRILRECNRGQDFLNNPQQFTEKALEIIARNRHSLAIDGISYIKLAGEEYFAQELFNSNELLGYLESNSVNISKDKITGKDRSVYSHIRYDSGVESDFAKSLDNDDDVKLFFKMPRRFTIETPIGKYNPDWCVYLEENGDKKLYFVLETKGTTSLYDLRSAESLKIRCGKSHFDALENEVDFPKEPVKEWKVFRKSM